MAGGIDNLSVIRDTETAKARGKLGGIASGEAKRKKKYFTELYTEMLAEEYDVEMEDESKKKMTGRELVKTVAKDVLSRRDSSTVSMLETMRKAIDGDELTLDGSLDSTITTMTHEQKLARIKELTGK